MPRPVGRSSPSPSPSSANRALSQFSISRSTRIDALVQQLVSGVSLLDAASPEFATAVQFCSFHTRHHQYLDVDTSQVGRFYDGLVARLEIASLHDRATKLAEQVERLNSLLCKDNCRERGVEETTGPALLSALFWLAGRPTAYRKIPSDNLSVLSVGSDKGSSEPSSESQSSQVADLGSLHIFEEEAYFSTDESNGALSAHDSDGSSEDGELDNFSHDKGETESEEEGCNAEAEEPAPPQLLMHEAYSRYSVQESPLLTRSLNNCKSSRKSLNLRELAMAVKEGRNNRYCNDQGTGAILLQREESIVLASVILLKYGKKSEIFTLSAANEWLVNERLNVTHLSHLSLSHILQTIVRTASTLQKIRGFCVRRIHTVDGKQCPVLVAIQSCIEDLLGKANKPLESVEAKCAHSLEWNSTVRVSMLELLEIIREEQYVTTLSTLEGLVDVLIPLERKGLDCGSLTASILDTIDAFEATAENNELSFHLVKEVNHEAIRVYSDAFLRLVCEAEIGDPHEQLPISVCRDSFGSKEVVGQFDSPEEKMMFNVCSRNSWPRRLWPIKGEIVQTLAMQALIKFETAFRSSQPSHPNQSTNPKSPARTRSESSGSVALDSTARVKERHSNHARGKSSWRTGPLASGSSATRDGGRAMDEFVSVMKAEIAEAGIILRDNLFLKWGFTDILEEIQAVFLFGAGDAMENFGALVFQLIDDHYLRKKAQSSPDFFTEIDLTGLLLGQFQDCGHGRAGYILQRTKIKLMSGVGEKPKPSSEDSLDDIWESMLHRINLRYSIPFPISTIIDGDDIQAYNGVWKFLLQLKWANMALDKCHQEFLFHGRERVKLRRVERHSTSDELWRGVNVVTFRISHFIRALQEYLMTRVVLVEWNAFTSLISKPDSCTSLERARQCHKSYLMSLQRQCLTALDKTWTVLALRLRIIIRLSFRLYRLCLTLIAQEEDAKQEEEASDAEGIKSQLRDIFVEFEDAHRFCIVTLHSKLKMGHFPHLEILYDRVVGHNRYYTGPLDRLDSLIEI